MKADVPDNFLGPYLTNQKIDSIDVYAKARIPVSDVRKMRSLKIESIPAMRLYLISLITPDSIGMLLPKIYPNLKLANIGKPISRNIKKDTSEVGNLIFSIEEYDLDILSHRTGIKRDRLLRLTKLDRTKIDAHELYLIEMASDKKPGILFEALYKDLALNTSEEEARLRKEEKIRGSKK